MLNRIIKYSLTNRLLIIVISLSLLIGGTYTVFNMEVDVFPDLTAPTVAILTDAHGMAAEEIEMLVSFPIESALNGATDVRRVRSSSSYGVSIIWVEFNWGTDIYKARQIVSEKLSTIIPHLPAGIDAPILAPQTSIMGEIMLVALTSDSLSMFDLRTIADKQVKQRLLSVTGISQIVVMGGRSKQYQILANPNKMKYFDVTLEDLVKISENTNSNASGGMINQSGMEYIVRGTARSNDVNDISNTVIKIKNGKSIKIRDVADVKIGSPTQIGDAYLNEKPSVILTVLKQPNTNTIDLTEKIDEAITDLQPSLPSDLKINTKIFRQADFINTSIRNVLRVILEGGFYVTIILILFLQNVRTTIISLTAIPLSLLLSVIVLKVFGMTFNTMSLGGMAIAIGSLVDDAIIDVENVYKRLRENFQKPERKRKNKLKVIYKASLEIRSSIVQATLIIIIAFMPLFFLSGMEGRMLKPLGITFIVSLFASLLVAITLTPVMSSYLLTTGRQLVRSTTRKNKFTHVINKYYSKSLVTVMHYKKTVIITSASLLVIAIFIFLQFGKTFLPDFNEGTLTIIASSQPGISLDESNKLAGAIDHQLLAIPEVKYVSRRTGRAELNEHSHGGSNSSEIDVAYNLESREMEDFMHEVRERLGNFQGVSINIGQPLGHRIDHMLSGTRASIAIKLFGTELTKMYALANTIKSNIADIQGLVDVNVEQLVEIPQVQITPRREMLARYGISINEFSHFIETALAGEKVAEVYENNVNFDLVLRYDESFRNSIESIRNSLIDTYNGEKIPLLYVADVKSVSGPNTINRENVQRKLVISANTASRDVGTAVNEIKNIIKDKIILPEGYRIEYGGQFESAQRASRLLLITSVLAIILIFLILYQEFKSSKLAAVVLINLPLAIIGGIFSVWITSNMLSIPVIIGFITLFGIATRNGILLVSRYEYLLKKGSKLRQSIIAGSTDRLNPIMMTALASALALLPLAMGGDKTGNEIQSPMAVVILGGLLTSTLLNLYVLPVVYSIVRKDN